MIRVRPAAGAAEVAASGRVVQAAYAEFGPDSGNNSIPGWVAYRHEQGEAAARARDALVLVAVDERDPGAQVVGTATLYLAPTRDSEHWRDGDAVVRFLAVLPAARGRGVGKALLDACIRLATEAGRPRLALHTVAPMATALGMYLRAGFVPDPAGDIDVDGFAIRAFALDLRAGGGARSPS